MSLDRMITSEEAVQYEKPLRNWLPITDARVVLDAFRHEAGLYALVQNEAKFWREAQVGLACAELVGAVRFRLGGDPPDFHLDIGGKERAFELTDVRPRGQRFHDEVKRRIALRRECREPKIVHIYQETLDAQLQSLVADTATSILKKMEKRYRDPYTLVLRVDHWNAGGWDELESELISHAKRALASFPEIWFFDGKGIMRVSSEGVERLGPWSGDLDGGDAILDWPL